MPLAFCVLKVYPNTFQRFRISATRAKARSESIKDLTTIIQDLEENDRSGKSTLLIAPRIAD
jgi:hypothetical protein